MIAYGRELRTVPGTVYRHARCVTNYGQLVCTCGAFALTWAAKAV